MRKQSQKGFSLIELMIAMVIIGLIASLIGPAMFGKVDSSKIKTAEAQMQLFATALDTYRLDVGVYPENLDELRESSNKNWDGPYFPKAIPSDPWNNAYLYQLEESQVSYKMFSKGKNGKIEDGGDDVVF